MITPTVPALSRGVQQISEPEDPQVDFESMYKRQTLADLNRASLDMAVEMNRRSTPQAAIEKRSAPRLSIAELNEMDMDALRERFEKLPPIDDRPGIMRVLDVIDLPRNLMANAITAVFAPELRRQALERGDRGAFGLPRVMGSDMLRAMGIDNRVVTAIGGFGIDILTDPLSFIGAPIGGLAVRSGKGVQAVFGRTGQKALMDNLKLVEKGGIGAVKDETVRRLFQTTAERHGLTELSGAKLREGLAGNLIGKRGGGVRRTADVILGTAGSGGDLANLIGRTVNNTDDLLEAAQIGAVKDFAEKFTFNRGLKLGKTGGTALAHLPFTDITLYGPAWTKAGKQAVLQRAIALAREGQYESADAFTAMQRLHDQADETFNEMGGLLAEREAIREAEVSNRPIEYAQDHLVGSAVLKGNLDKKMRTDIRLATKKGRDRVAAENEMRDAGSLRQQRLIRPDDIDASRPVDESVLEIVGGSADNTSRSAIARRVDWLMENDGLSRKQAVELANKETFEDIPKQRLLSLRPGDRLVNRNGEVVGVAVAGRDGETVRNIHRVDDETGEVYQYLTVRTRKQRGGDLVDAPDDDAIILATDSRIVRAGEPVIEDAERMYPNADAVNAALVRGEILPTDLVSRYLDDLSDEALSTYVQRGSVDYRRTNKAEDIEGIAQTDTGQVGLTAIAMLAKEDGVLKGKSMVGLDPSYVRVGDEFEIGDATARVIDDLGDSVEVEVTYPERLAAREALPGVDEGGEAFSEVVAQGFVGRYVIPKTDDNYIPANREGLGRRVIREPEDAITLNNRRLRARREKIRTLESDINAQLELLSKDGARVFTETTEIGDVLAMAEMADRLAAKANLLRAQGQWVEASEEIAYARKVRQQGRRAAAYQSFQEVEGRIPEEFIVRSESMGDAGTEILYDEMITALDNMAPDDARYQAYTRLRNEWEGMQSENIRSWLGLLDEDMDAAMRVAEAFSSVAATAQSVAKAANRGVRQYLDSEAQTLRRVAARILGMGDDVVGQSLVDVAVSPFSKAMANYGSSEIPPESRAALLGLAGLRAQKRTTRAAEGVTQAMGVGFMGMPNGMIDAMRAKAQATVRVASKTEGKSVREMLEQGGGPFSKGLKTLASEYGIDADDVPHLGTLVTALAAAKQQASPFWATKIDGTPSDAALYVSRAMESGILRGRDGLLDELRVLADELNDEFVRYGDGAVANGTLKVRHDNYIPTAMHEQYANAARQARSVGLGESSSAATSMTAAQLESFQKAKGTWEIRFQSPDGTPKSFILANARLYRAVKGDKNVYEQLRIRNAKAQEVIEEVNAIVDEFEALHGSIDDVEVINAFGRPLDPFTLNRMAREDHLFLDLTGKYTGDMWQTNAADLIDMTARQHAVADAKRALADAVAPLGIDLARIIPVTGEGKSLTMDANGLLNGEVVGGRFRTADGTVGVVLDRRRMRIGDRTYKVIDQTKLDRLEINPFADMYTEGQMRYFFPEPVTDTIERFAEQLQPENVKMIFELADQLTRAWRASTLLHPSWTIFNVIGSMFIGAMRYRKELPQFVQNVQKAIKILVSQSDPRALAAMEVRNGGQTMTADGVLQITETGGLSNAGRSYEAGEHVLRNGYQPEAVRDPLPRNPAALAQRGMRRIKEKYAQAMEEHTLLEALRLNSIDGRAVDPSQVKQSHRMRLAASASAVLKDGPFRSVMQSWFRMNGMIDDAFRIGAFLQNLDNGMDATEAVIDAKRSFFNFSDMTQFENTKLRALMPFYAWLRGSAPAMLMNLRDDPLYFTIMPKAFEAMEELFAGEEQVPRHRRPRWINETLGIQIGTDPETRKVLLAGTLLPQEQALQLASGVAGIAGALTPGNQGFGGREMMDLLDFFLGQTGPIVKIPLELSLGRETFSGRTIGPTATEGDISMQEYLLGQVRWLRETGVGSVRDGALQRSFEDGIGQGVGRLLIGGRLQPGLQEDRRQYGIRRDMAEREAQIRRAFNLAQREDNQEAMLKARDELMSLYRDFLRSGGDPSDIPKWAREDLAELGVAVEQQ